MTDNDDWLDTDRFVTAYQQEGRDEGTKDGLLHGFQEGYQLGRTTAIDYGMELGFIQGCAQILSENSCSENEKKNLDSLQQALADFPDPDIVFQNSASEETKTVREQMQRVRARFKVVATQFGLPMLSLEKVMKEANLARDQKNVPQTLEW
jgi:hypothetical protein